MKNHPKQVQNDTYINFWRPLKLEPKLLSSRNLSGLFNFMRPFIWCKTWGVNWRTSEVWPKSFMKMGHWSVFFIFDIYYVALKIVMYVISYTVYASLIKILLKFEFIKAYLSSFRSILSSYRNILNIFKVFWAHLGSFTLILAFDSFRLI